MDSGIDGYQAWPTGLMLPQRNKHPACMDIPMEIPLAPFDVTNV